MKDAPFPDRHSTEGIGCRRAAVEDAAALAEYRIRFLNEMYGRDEGERSRAMRGTLEDYFRAAIRSNDFVAWLAERDGEVVGTSGMVVWRIPARYDGPEDGRIGYILNLYTVPHERGKGICTRLLDELIAEARRMRIRYLHLHATGQGIGIYERAGFTEPHLVEMELRLDS